MHALHVFLDSLSDLFLNFDVRYHLKLFESNELIQFCEFAKEDSSFSTRAKEFDYLNIGLLQFSDGAVTLHRAHER